MSKIWKDKDRVYYCEDCNKEVRVKAAAPALVAAGLCVSCYIEKLEKYFTDRAVDILAEGNHD